MHNWNHVEAVKGWLTRTLRNCTKFYKCACRLNLQSEAVIYQRCYPIQWCQCLRSTAVRCINSLHPCFVSSDSICSLVVLHLQRRGVPGYSLFHPQEEVQPGQLPPRLPPLHHVHPLVDRHQMGPRWTVWVKRLFFFFFFNDTQLLNSSDLSLCFSLLMHHTLSCMRAVYE